MERWGPSAVYWSIRSISAKSIKRRVTFLKNNLSQVYSTAVPDIDDTKEVELGLSLKLNIRTTSLLVDVLGF